MNCSFQPNGKWFVFDSTTGETIHKDFPAKRSALAWMAREADRIRLAAAECAG